MPQAKKSTEKPNQTNDTGANLGFEAKLWAAADPIYDRAFSNTIEGQTLAILRETLLPKLISGDLRIGDPLKVASA